MTQAQVSVTIAQEERGVSIMADAAATIEECMTIETFYTDIDLRSSLKTATFTGTTILSLAMFSSKLYGNAKLARFIKKVRYNKPTINLQEQQSYPVIDDDDDS